MSQVLLQKKQHFFSLRSRYWIDPRKSTARLLYAGKWKGLSYTSGVRRMFSRSFLQISMESAKPADWSECHISLCICLLTTVKIFTFVLFLRNYEETDRKRTLQIQWSSPSLVRFHIFCATPAAKNSCRWALRGFRPFVLLDVNKRSGSTARSSNDEDFFFKCGFTRNALEWISSSKIIIAVGFYFFIADFVIHSVWICFCPLMQSFQPPEAVLGHIISPQVNG